MFVNASQRLHRASQPASQLPSQPASQPVRPKKSLPKQQKTIFSKMKVLLETFPKIYQKTLTSLCFTMSLPFLGCVWELLVRTPRSQLSLRGGLGRKSVCGEAQVAFLRGGNRGCKSACGEAQPARQPPSRLRPRPPHKQGCDLGLPRGSPEKAKIQQNHCEK